MTFTIPESELPEFLKLPATVRNGVQDMLNCMKYIYESAQKIKACKELSEQRGKHYNSFYNAWKKFRKLGWKALIDRRYCSEFWKTEKPKGLPQEFINHWRLLTESNQRSSRAAHAQLITQWRSWELGHSSAHIPGYATCPPPARNSRLPKGWSYDNLLKHLSTDVQLAAAREGREAAKALSPSIITHTKNMYPMQEIEFDDMWHDFEAMVPGQPTPSRLIEFGSIDVRTGFIFRPAIKPRLRNLESKKMEQLNERDFRLYLVNFLRSVGYHPEGTTLRTEKGTASLRITSKEGKKFVDKLSLYTGGLVKIVEPGMIGDASHVGAYKERAKGNFRCKARKEGIHKLIHNTLASLPGQVGMSADRMPAEYHGRAHEQSYLTEAALLDPSLAETLQNNFYDLQTACSAIYAATEQINNRTDHSIADWEDYTTNEYRITETVDQWISPPEWERLPETQRDLILSLSRDNANLARSRRLSPSEVIQTITGALIKIPLAAVADLLARDWEKERTVKRGLIEFEDAELGSGKHRFKAILKEESGLTKPLDNEDSYLTIVNPFEPERMLIRDFTGRYLGHLERYHAVDRTDEEALQRQIGKANRDFKNQLAEVGIRHGDARLSKLQKNTRTLKASLEPTKKQRDRALQLSDPSLTSEDFLSSERDPSPVERPEQATLDPDDLLQ